ncbi:hypothetical protein [Subtercola endophyticus]|uniref:hypothetical protein n=1 Tax=Subtercola endophyticus TaxID=2895559 RepID=UPI001E4605C6|nr:hypothetical protein [Subtercola endophyticus]UFS59508.1 hypothetical protein LQ955_01520 [Subtercola endophyticus]
MSDYYNRAGEKIGFDGYVKEFSKDRTVALTKVGEAEVSTVFLVIDHGFGRGEPVLFESMIFGGPRDQEGWRYHTEAEALSGHNALVAELQAATS